MPLDRGEDWQSQQRLPVTWLARLRCATAVPSGSRGTGPYCPVKVRNACWVGGSAVCCYEKGDCNVVSGQKSKLKMSVAACTNISFIPKHAFSPINWNVVSIFLASFYDTISPLPDYKCNLRSRT
jgi:hypothetical protein